jgi:hypothetical protein
MKIHGSGVGRTGGDPIMVMVGRQYQHVIVVHIEDLIFKTDLPFSFYHVDKIVNGQFSCGVHTRLVKKAKVG